MQQIQELPSEENPDEAAQLTTSQTLRIEVSDPLKGEQGQMFLSYFSKNDNN